MAEEEVAMAAEASAVAVSAAEASAAVAMEAAPPVGAEAAAGGKNRLKEVECMHSTSFSLILINFKLFDCSLQTLGCI